jgi:hypothetical protein
MDPFSASLSILKPPAKYSFWVLVVLAIATSGVLNLSNLASELPSDWVAKLKLLQPYFWVGVFVFAIVLHLAQKQARKKFSITYPMPHTHLWQETKQQDGSVYTLIAANVLVKNLTDKSLGIASAILKSPAIEAAILDGRALIKEQGSSYSSTTMGSGSKIGPFDSCPVSLSLIIGASIEQAKAGKNEIEATLAIVDEDGYETKFTTTFNVQ